MKFEDVNLGMKVVPHSKSVWDNGENFEDYINGSSYYDSGPNFFRNNGYLEVVDYDTEIEAFILGGFDGVDGDYFLAEDFEPYEEVKKVEEFEDKKTGLKEDELNLLSETFSKIFKEPIRLINNAIDVAKEFDNTLVNIANPNYAPSKTKLSQRKLDRAESFYNALKSTLQVMDSEVDARNDILPHLRECEMADTIKERIELEDSINWAKDAYAMAIADCLNIDYTRDDYFNVLFDAITNDYGFTWMIEKLKYEEVI